MVGIDRFLQQFHEGVREGSYLAINEKNEEIVASQSIMQPLDTVLAHASYKLILFQDIEPRQLQELASDVDILQKRYMSDQGTIKIELDKLQLVVQKLLLLRTHVLEQKEYALKQKIMDLDSAIDQLHCINIGAVPKSLAAESLTLCKQVLDNNREIFDKAKEIADLAVPKKIMNKFEVFTGKLLKERSLNYIEVIEDRDLSQCIRGINFVFSCLKLYPEFLGLPPVDNFSNDYNHFEQQLRGATLEQLEELNDYLKNDDLEHDGSNPSIGKIPVRMWSEKIRSAQPLAEIVKRYRSYPIYKDSLTQLLHHQLHIVRQQQLQQLQAKPRYAFI